MARRKASKKLQPAVQTMTFQLSGSGTNYIDLSQCASLLNRRFYRQGLNWAVAGFTLQCYQGVSAYANISKLPNTWVTSNAWEKGFHVWRRMIKNAQDDSGMESVEGRYSDFKIFMDWDHYNGNNDFQSNLIPQDAEGYAWHDGSWAPSLITIPDAGGIGNNFKLMMLGENDPSGQNVKSLIQGYADSRSLPQESDPNLPDDAASNWYLDVFDEGTVQDSMVINNILTNSETQNPPYPLEDGIAQDGTPYTDTQYPGGENNPHGFGGRELHYPLAVRSDAVGSNSSAPGSNFPCGLIAVEAGVTLNDPSSGLDAVARLLVHMVPGDHKGYLCEKMQDM